MLEMFQFKKCEIVELEMRGDSVKFVIEKPSLCPLVLGSDHSISHPVVWALTENLGESETWGRCERRLYLN
jgi:arginase family enzyme